MSTRGISFICWTRKKNSIFTLRLAKTCANIVIKKAVNPLDRQMNNLRSEAAQSAKIGAAYFFIANKKI